MGLKEVLEEGCVCAKSQCRGTKAQLLCRRLRLRVGGSEQETSPSKGRKRKEPPYAAVGKHSTQKHTPTQTPVSRTYTSRQSLPFYLFHEQSASISNNIIYNPLIPTAIHPPGLLTRPQVRLGLGCQQPHQQTTNHAPPPTPPTPSILVATPPHHH